MSGGGETAASGRRVQRGLLGVALALALGMLLCA